MGHFALTGAACQTNMGGSTVSDASFEKILKCISIFKIYLLLMLVTSVRRCRYPVHLKNIEEKQTIIPINGTIDCQMAQRLVLAVGYHSVLMDNVYLMFIQ